MQQHGQKLDTKRPYGTVIGHDWAKFEQDGNLYDFSGRVPGQVYLDDEDEPPKAATEPVEGRDFALENAKEFLKNLLSGGPITKSAVFKEAENNNQVWDKVQSAFAQMNGEKVKRGNWTLWKLPAE
jgi:hypothetical protein